MHIQKLYVSALINAYDITLCIQLSRSTEVDRRPPLVIVRVEVTGSSFVCFPHFDDNRSEFTIFKIFFTPMAAIDVKLLYRF